MDPLLSIDWQDRKSHVLFNPRLPASQLAILQKAKETLLDLDSHIWVGTSGTTSGGKIKYVGLSKLAILTSAEAVNKHLQTTDKDCWFNPLPRFHVGGLGAEVRAYVGSYRHVAYTGKWDPRSFTDQILLYRASLTSLVPTQVYDIVQQELHCPSSIRAVVIGGGALSLVLKDKAKALGWPLLQSYGLSEASSQVATEELGQEGLVPLCHLQVECLNGWIRLKSPSLLSYYAYLTEEEITLQDPKVDGWFTTEDRGQYDHKILSIFGRDADFAKIGGENVNLLALQQHLEKFFNEENISAMCRLVALPDKRLGQAVHLCIEGTRAFEKDKIIERFNRQVMPFERIQKVHAIASFPRSALGKILIHELKSQLLQENSFADFN